MLYPIELRAQLLIGNWNGVGEIHAGALRYAVTPMRDGLFPLMLGVEPKS